MLFPGLKALDEEMGISGSQSRSAVKCHTVKKSFVLPVEMVTDLSPNHDREFPGRHVWRTCQHSLNQQPKKGKYFGELHIPGRFRLISEFLFKMLNGSKTWEMNGKLITFGNE